MFPVTNNVHASSVLLNQQENDQLFQLLGPKCQSLAAAVVQVFTTDGPHDCEWIKRDAGILCFVRDKDTSSFFFRLYCLIRNTVIWEYEMYTNMQYMAPKPFLHTFEADDSIIAFNFANENEADFLQKAVLKQLESEDKRKIPGRKQRKKGITKKDISEPSNFQHISHVGWNEVTGFNMKTDDPSLRQIFEKAGITEDDLVDKETLEFIYHVIDRNGGMDAVKREVQELSEIPPPLPPFPASWGIPRTQPQNPPSLPRTAPRTSATRTHTKKPTGTNRTTSSTSNGNPPSPRAGYPANAAVRNGTRPPSRSPSHLPPPPPALPPILEPVDAKNTITSNTSSSGSDPRSALLSAIRKGTKLKSVSTEVNTRSVSNARVQPVTETPSSSGSAGYNISDVLRRALAEREKHIHSSDSDSSEAYESNSEWDD